MPDGSQGSPDIARSTFVSEFGETGSIGRKNAANIINEKFENLTPEQTKEKAWEEEKARIRETKVKSEVFAKGDFNGNDLSLEAKQKAMAEIGEKIRDQETLTPSQLTEKAWEEAKTTTTESVIPSPGATVQAEQPVVRQAWDAATRIGKPVKEEGGSGDLLARMEKERQLVDHSKDANAEAKPVETTPAPISPIEQKPALVTTPESQVVPSTVVSLPPTGEQLNDEVLLNKPKNTIEQKQAEADAKRKAEIEADMKAKSTPTTETSDNPTVVLAAETAGQKVESEVDPKANADRLIEQVNKDLKKELEGKSLKDQAEITRKFYIDRSGYKVKIGGWLHDTDIITNEKGKIIKKINPFIFAKREGETNKFLKSEVETIIRERSGEAVPPPTQETQTTVTKTPAKAGEEEANNKAEQPKVENLTGTLNVASIEEQGKQRKENNFNFVKRELENKDNGEPNNTTLRIAGVEDFLKDNGVSKEEIDNMSAEQAWSKAREFVTDRLRLDVLQQVKKTEETGVAAAPATPAENNSAKPVGIKPENIHTEIPSSPEEKQKLRLESAWQTYNTFRVGEGKAITVDELRAQDLIKEKGLMPPLTKEAQELTEGIKTGAILEGYLPGEIPSNLKRILNENGISDNDIAENDMNTLIKMLGENRVSQGEQPVGGAPPGQEAINEVQEGKLTEVQKAQKVFNDSVSAWMKGSHDYEEALSNDKSFIAAKEIAEKADVAYKNALVESKMTEEEFHSTQLGKDLLSSTADAVINRNKAEKTFQSGSGKDLFEREEALSKAMHEARKALDQTRTTSAS